ncbi:hypothetical protein ACQEVZ_41090 [Dactylosporangium sp. CA-152071]|uniref:hypothetical protein n=1 Tax=Dactylosporangium sp. CA-152071 TaxID=3239933 RepID=UPI003D8D4A6D
MHAVRRWRSSPAYLLVAIAVLATGFVVYAHWNPRNYLSLRPVAEAGPTTTVALAVPVMLALAALMAMAPARPRTVTAAALLALLVPIACAGFAEAKVLVDDCVPEPAVGVARSPDGRWDVVRVRYHCSSDSDGYLDKFLLRSRAGWLSRESALPVAVVQHSFVNSMLAEVVRVEFAAGNAVVLHTWDGAVQSTTFDPGSLAFRDRFGHCEHDPALLCPE